VDRHRLDADPDPDLNLHLMPIQIRIGTKTMPIHTAIILKVLLLLENRGKNLLLFAEMPIYEVFPFSQGKWQSVNDIKYFRQHIKFFWKKVKNT
jgi:hypothetical protein